MSAAPTNPCVSIRVMASRRQVRQATIQFLYARSASPDDQGGDDFWALVNDQASITFDRARVKVLAHFQQGREAVVQKLQKALVDHAAAILALGSRGKVSRELKAMAAAEFLWAERCGNLLRLTRANTGGWRRDLEKLLPEIDQLRATRATLAENLSEFPALPLAQFSDLFTKLDTYDQRARFVRFPEKYPDQRDLDHLHRLQGEMAGLAEEARELAEKVEADYEELDTTIDAASANFDLKRLARVDLAILRLATWEILKRPDLDAAVSITEAVDLARSFSGEESAAFVNGVLDHIAKA